MSFIKIKEKGRREIIKEIIEEDFSELKRHGMSLG